MTGTWLERKATQKDYYLIKTVMDKYATRLKKSGAKSWYNYIDVDTVMKRIYDHEIYILDEEYLVVYEITSPWYNDEVLFLQEIIVLRLGQGDFSKVPAFLKRKGKEAGAVLVGVGTALARNDAALASMYQRFGFTSGDITLTLEP